MMVTEHEGSRPQAAPAHDGRPLGVTVLSVFFLAGAFIALATSISLLNPGGVLEPMWKLNPRAREDLKSLGIWAVALMSTVSAACAASAAGLWTGARWGHPLALCLLVVNVIGDVINVLVGSEPRAVVGIPIAAFIIGYLTTRRVRRYFSRVTG